jgi:glycosyltransferase involved in cell wall biosynthesis
VRIAYHCQDVVGLRMAGPGIRAVELSRRLAEHHEVTLVAEGAHELAGETFRASRDLGTALRGAEAFITQGFGFPLPQLLRFRGRLLLDLYDPVQLEQLAHMGPSPTPEQVVQVGYVRRRLHYLIRRADHVLCASRPQRALWLGWLGACGRLTPRALAEDPQASRLLAVVPFGLPETPPLRDGSPLRAAIGAAPGDPVALWAGGLWDWMDPALAVRAATLARQRIPGLKLALLAGQRPGTAAPPMRAAADEARAVAGAGVHFVDRWVPYEERGAWLLDADVAVSAHKPSLEAELAFRTRLLDCLWAALPAACTAGDVLASEGEQQGWARTAPTGDHAALADALVALCDPGTNQKARDAARLAAASRTWQRSADTVLELLDSPAPPRPALLSRETPALTAVFARKVLRKLLGRAPRLRGR